MSAHSLSLTLNERTGDYYYNRTGHRLQKDVSEHLGQLYDFNQDHVSVVSSGMEAIAVTFQNIMIENQFKKFNIIYSDELYCDTPRFIKYFNQIYGVSSIDKFNVLEPEELEKKFEARYRNGINVLFLEFCSNPNGNILDMSIISKLRKLSKKFYLVIDNTWTTDVIVNPFHHGADVVVSSMSKHYSGGGCIGGFVIAKDTDFSKNLANYLKISGKHISLPYCEIFLENMPKMAGRIRNAYARTLEIAKALDRKEKEGKIKKVSYPLLDSHPSKALAIKYFQKCGPSVLTFVVPLEKKKAVEWMRSFKTIKYKTSFGSNETKFDPWPRRIDGSKTQCRLSVGYDCDAQESTQEVIQELESKIENLS